MIVPGRGKLPNAWMILGQSPGKDEALSGKPFVGKAGMEQERYLSRHGLHSSQAYVTNLVNEYIEGNPDPTPKQIEENTPRVWDEIAECNPKVIFSVGRYATRWLLGDVDMDTVHGIPHLANGMVVMPVLHPAAGFYDQDAKALISRDYESAAEVLKLTKMGKPVDVRVDEWEGEESYTDVSGKEVWGICSSTDGPISLDTEGYPADPWSLQISLFPGTGRTLRWLRDDFPMGVSALQEAADRGVVFIMHNAMFDMEMCRAMGLDLSRARIWDTMYAAYLLRLEPQGLKALAWRWCGMKMASYKDTVGNAGRAKQIEYLKMVASSEWPYPGEIKVEKNDGTVKVSKPQRIEKRAAGIIRDCESGKVNKKGELVDPFDRWHAANMVLREPVEDVLGPMPIGTLADLPLDQAIRYASRDPDATLRLYHKLVQELQRKDLLTLMDHGMETLPVFEEMQRTGMPAYRPHFKDLSLEMWAEMCEIQACLSQEYYGGKPFNPASNEHVASLMRRRGLKGFKFTKTGKMSTGKQSIEYLRKKDPAISEVFEWRERQHIKDSFCAPILDRIPDGEDYAQVRCTLKVTRTATRRLASADPNLLAIPIRSELGRRVREGYKCQPGEVLGAWDLSQIEMRVLAHESADPVLCKIFHDGRDIHTETACKIFGLTPDKLDKFKHRIPAKTVGFGIAYGQGPEGLHTQLRMLGIEDWDLKGCKKLIADYLKLYKGVKKYIEDTQEQATKQGYVRDCWGMYRYLPGVWSDDNKVSSEARRIAVNHKIQGGAQGLIQRSIAYLRPIVWEMQDSGMNVKWNLSVHDEIIMQMDEDLYEIVDPIVMDALTQHGGIKMRVPIEAEGHKASNWGELK